MDIYKKMFIRMSVGVEEAIRILVEAQRDCEDMFVKSEEFTGQKPEFQLINLSDIKPK